jgi:hypothetical protein
MPYKDLKVQREYQRRWMAERRAEWLADKACVKCGSVEDLEVDHIDRNQKVTHRVWSWTAARREAELAKCQVLCGSHHLEKTMAETYQAPHGTHHRYTHHGCRCVECRKAHAAVNRGYRQQSSAAAAAKRDVA